MVDASWVASTSKRWVLSASCLKTVSTRQSLPSMRLTTSCWKPLDWGGRIMWTGCAGAEVGWGTGAARDGRQTSSRTSQREREKRCMRNSNEISRKGKVSLAGGKEQWG